MDLSNTDNTESIVAIFMGGGTGDSTAQTDTVTLNADDIGLPAGGTATLTIQGSGINYTMAATADANGTITYEIPAIATGSEITVTLTVKAADGTMLYTGSNTKTVSGGQFQMDIQLARQFWTLPASLTVTASPASLLYDTSTWDTVSATFSISGLEGAPTGAAISYRWEDAAAPGTAVGTGPSLTMTVHQLLGGTLPAGEITKTYTVTASYTDTAGEAKTASGSASVTSVFWLTIPDFKITMTAPTGLETVTSGSNTVYLVTDADMASIDASKKFSFTAELKNASDSWPDGVTYTWSFNGTPSFSDSAGATAGGLTNLTAAPINETAVTVTCTVELPGTLLTKDAESSVTVRIKKGLSVDDLSSYLSSLPTGSASAPNVLPPIIGLTSSTDIKTAITNVLYANSSKYVDLSETQLPDGINMLSAFYIATATPLANLVKAPKLPSMVASNSLNATFANCINLVEPPVIPDGITEMSGCFQWCHKLTTAPNIPDTVTGISNCFDFGSHSGYPAASALIGPSTITIPAGVTNMNKCFNHCLSLKNVNIVIKNPNTGTNWTWAFNDFPASANVTIYVPNADVQAEIMAMNWYDNTKFRVEIGSGPSGP